MIPEPRPIEILLVEDNPGDVSLCEEALGESKMRNHLAVVGDGEEAMAYLRREDPFADAVRPDLILLDLNLPRMDGREVLEAIKSDDALKEIPVVILSSSAADRDVEQSYQHHANCYVVKPLDFQQFVNIVRNIHEFWFQIVRLPGS